MHKTQIIPNIGWHFFILFIFLFVFGAGYFEIVFFLVYRQFIMWPFRGDVVEMIERIIGDDPFLQARMVDQVFFGPAARMIQNESASKYLITPN